MRWVQGGNFSDCVVHDGKIVGRIWPDNTVGSDCYFASVGDGHAEKFVDRGSAVAYVNIGVLTQINKM